MEQDAVDCAVVDGGCDAGTVGAASPVEGTADLGEDSRAHAGDIYMSHDVLAEDPPEAPIRERFDAQQCDSDKRANISATSTEVDSSGLDRSFVSRVGHVPSSGSHGRVPNTGQAQDGTRKNVWGSRRLGQSMDQRREPAIDDDGDAGTSSMLTHEPVASDQNPRVYQVWPQLGGHNRFCCRGYCITGPRIDFWYNLCAWSFLIIPVVCYFVFVAADLWVVTPLLPILTGAVFVSTVIFMLLTSCTDPGIIPRHALQVAVIGLEHEVAEVVGVEPPLIDADSADPICPLTDNLHLRGFRWCTTCKTVRPPRASHCRDCDNCILTHDHHCPFVNNCIGQRNYPFFAMFLISTACLGLAVVSGFVMWLSAQDTGSNEQIHNVVLYSLLFAIGAPTAVLLIGVLGLSCFHVWLAFQGRTTREALRGQSAAASNRKLAAFRGASLIHARDRVSYPFSLV
eukprot:TRINITY_DN61155_c0_g1_i1.p1 TRINITY_DN61155_c0_g1~~TRINITY_DN61155_c0_g1_i1.p1  ORF type:complete len:455 (-),score=38.54 TRINITY_DN61155_c0_g1_i1:143-1507(-)